jgi:protein SDA1
MDFELYSILFKCLLRLNAVREICSRCPLVMSEDLLRDLAQYKNYKERSVMMAARSLIHLYRASMPELLHKKDRVCIYVILT